MIQIFQQVLEAAMKITYDPENVPAMSKLQF
jgi:hypothetical protein